MNDMRIPPALLNTIQGPSREGADGRDGRSPGQPDIEATRAFDRLFEHALRTPEREKVGEPVREPVRERGREPVREQAREATRNIERTPDRNAQADGAPAPSTSGAERAAQDRHDQQGKRTDDATDDGNAEQVRRPDGARSAPASDAQAKERGRLVRHGATGDATEKNMAAGTATPTAPLQLSLDAALHATDAQASSAHVLDELQAASAALLQAAQGLAAAGQGVAGATSASGDGAAKAAPVLKTIDGSAPAGTGGLKDGKESKDAKAGKAAAPVELTPADLGAATDAQARNGVRDRLLEDFDRRFERSLAAAASGGREGFTPGTPQALAGLASGTSAQQPLYSSAHASIATPLNYPAFGDDLSNRVLLFAGQRVQNAELAITPADLGPIKVSIELRGQEASLAFTAQHATTRAAIEDALPKLREMFAGQGLQLTQAHVGDQRRQDSERYGNGNGSRNGEASRIERGSSIGAGGTGGLPNAYGVRGIGLIDIHV